MAWINEVSYEEARGKLKKIYDRIKGPDNYIDNILTVHGLRPHTLEGHMSIYKNVLHHSGNSFPKWFLEAIGVYTSLLNKCSYCVEHHYEGMKRLIGDDDRSTRIREALESEIFDDVFTDKESTVLEYCRILTENPSQLDEHGIKRLKEAGLDDGEILEVNQVSAYFAYANRTVLGLGVNTENDILGLSPGDSEDPDNWHHG